MAIKNKKLFKLLDNVLIPALLQVCSFVFSECETSQSEPAVPHSFSLNLVPSSRVSTSSTDTTTSFSTDTTTRVSTAAPPLMTWDAKMRSSLSALEMDQSHITKRVKVGQGPGIEFF